MTASRSRALVRLACVVMTVLAGTLAGCVNHQKKDMDSARVALEECIAEHSAEHPDCVIAERRMTDAQARYDDAARRAWSCDPTQDLCPTPR